MVVSLTNQPGFADTPDSRFAAGELARGFDIIKVLSNTNFALVRPEMFQGVYRDGDVVPLPTSPVDGYPYARDELLYHWSIFTTLDKGGARGGPGTILAMDWRVEQPGEADPGTVHISTWYHKRNGATTVTQDGAVYVTTIAQRRRRAFTATGVPAIWIETPPLPANQDDTEYDLDSAYREREAQRWNRNSKFVVLNCEVFYLGEMKHGDTLPASSIISPIDGYVYGSEFQGGWFPNYYWRWTPEATFSGKYPTSPSTPMSPPPAPDIAEAENLGSNRSAAGTLRRLQAFMSGLTTNILVDYYERPTTTGTNDGRVALFAFAIRAFTANLFGAFPPPHFEFNQIPSTAFFPGKKLLDGNTIALNRLQRFALMRPEIDIYPSNIRNGSFIDPQFSNLDLNYQWTAPETVYVSYLRDTAPSSPPAGAILEMGQKVKQSTGIVEAFTNYYNPGGSQSNTTGGRLLGVYNRYREKVQEDSDPDLSRGGTDEEKETVIAQLLRGVPTESATFVEVGSVPAFIPGSFTTVEYKIRLVNSGVADVDKQSSGKVQVDDGVTPVDSTVFQTTAGADEETGDVTVTSPPTGSVTLRLFARKDQVAAWTGDVTAYLLKELEIG